MYKTNWQSKTQYVQIQGLTLNIKKYKEKGAE